MGVLDALPTVSHFFGMDLKSGALIIAAVGIVHPMSYGCSFFLPISYILLTVWGLVAMYFIASICLLYGIVKENEICVSIWIWYSLAFVLVMLMLMIMLGIVYYERRQRQRVFIVFAGIFWYLLTIYFILVINGFRMMMLKNEAVTNSRTFF